MIQWIPWAVGSVLYLIVVSAGQAPAEQTIKLEQPIVQQQAGTNAQPITEIKVITVPDTSKLPTVVPVVSAPAPKTANTVTPTAQPSESNLSNDNYYTNTAGNSVHAPAHSDQIPAGATAQCKNGKYSFSQSRRGTCSGNGGVARWL